MAISTPPPPPDPPSTTAATAAGNLTASRSLFPNPNRPTTTNPINPFYTQPPRLPSNPNPNYHQLASRPTTQLMYPVASSGRGFLRPASTRPVSRPPFTYNYQDQANLGFVRPTQFGQPAIGSVPVSTGGGGVIMPGVVKGIPVSNSQNQKVGPAPALNPERNGQKDLRDRNRDGTLAVIRERKVQIPNNASLYALCRSWLRNGFPGETQPQHVDAVRSLPRPLPIAAQVTDSPLKNKDDEEHEDDGSIENLSTKELLQRLVKRSKRVRSRLREERLRRITRYKDRLALLLPEMAEQPLKNDSDETN